MKTVIVATTLSALLLVSPLSVIAQTREASLKERLEQRRENLATRVGELRERGRERACEVRKRAFGKRHEQTVKMATKMLQHFSARAMRSQEFYTNKVLPTGKTVPNYEALVADVAAKKLAVEQALDQLKTDAQNFACPDREERQATESATFRQNMQKVKRALYEYRKSIKNLIKAIKDVAKEVKKERKSATESGSDE